MNIAYLIHTLKTNKLSDVVGNIDLPLLDINIAIWDAEKAGQIEVDRSKDRIKLLLDAEPWCNDALATKIIRACQYYEAQEINLTIGKLNHWVKNQASDYNYPWHEYVMTLQYLLDTKQLVEEEITVPKMKDRPFQRFVFLCFPKNNNEEWNAREVSRFISNWKSNKIK